MTRRSDEITVFEACVDWARHNLSKASDSEDPAASSTVKNKPPSDAQLRSELSDVIYHVRLPLLSLEDFARYIGKSAVILPEEKRSLLEYITSKGGQKSLKFDSRRRTAARGLPQFSENVVERYGGLVN